jgi:endo-1,4-beta-xylanase
LKRRDFLCATAGGACSLVPKLAKAGADSLRHKAEAKGLVYGCAVKSRNLRDDAQFRAAVTNEAGILVPEYELKRQFIQPEPDRYDFAAVDFILGSAARDGQKARGHTLVWYDANPAWLPNALNDSTTATAKAKLLTEYIAFVAKRYASRMHSWDVVNEAVEPDNRRSDGMRSQSIWYEALGEDYISLAFHAAKQADPHALLFLNDFGVEAPIRWNDRRRKALLNLLDRLKSKDVPVEAFGIQGHLHPYRDGFDAKVFAQFIHDLEGYGIKLMITELDVSDRGGPDDPQKRDADVAAVTKDFLNVALESRQTVGVLTWGLADRYTWLSASDKYKWPDGELPRALPLDGSLARKPMWDAISSAFDLAANRRQ